MGVYPLLNRNRTTPSTAIGNLCRCDVGIALFQILPFSVSPFIIAGEVEHRNIKKMLNNPFMCLLYSISSSYCLTLMPSCLCHYFTDQKEKMEAQNQSMVLTFGSQLDQCLKDLHRTILGSVSQQQQHLRCMEEHASSYLASKCDVRK